MTTPTPAPNPAPAPAAAPTPAAPVAPTTIPIDRFKTVVNERNALKEQIATLTGQVQGFTEQAAMHGALVEKNATLTTELASANGRYDRFESIAAHGITDKDSVAIVEMMHSRLPETDRPALGDWMGGFAEKPDTLPAAIAHLFNGTQTPGITPAQTPRPLPNGNRGVQTHRGSPGPTDIRSMSAADLAAAHGIKLRRS